MRLRNKSKLIAEDNNLQYTKLKDTEGSVLKTFSKRGRTNVGHLINPPTRYKFDHTVALESIIEEGVENSPINWNELRRKAQESKKLLFKQNEAILIPSKEMVDNLNIEEPKPVPKILKQRAKVKVLKRTPKPKKDDENQNPTPFLIKLLPSNLFASVLTDKSNKSVKLDTSINVQSEISKSFDLSSLNNYSVVTPLASKPSKETYVLQNSSPILSSTSKSDLNEVVQMAIPDPVISQSDEAVGGRPLTVKSKSPSSALKSIKKIKKPKSRCGVTYKSWNKDILLSEQPLFNFTNKVIKTPAELSQFLMVKSVN